MHKRFVGFISSTKRDLEPQRLAVYRTLINLGCFPVSMESFPGGFDTTDFIGRQIRASDFVVLITNLRYGDRIPPAEDERRRSFTEWEYDFATAAGKPVIPLVRKELPPLPADASEADRADREALVHFREKLTLGKTVDLWEPNTKDEDERLTFRLTNALNFRLQELDADERAGYYKASELPHRLTAVEEAILRPSRKLGITHMLPGNARQEELNLRLTEAMDIRILTTTGTTFFRNKQMELTAAIGNGGRLRVMFGEPNSPFFTGVAEMEAAHKDQDVAEVMDRLNREVADVRATLRGVLRSAGVGGSERRENAPIRCGYIGTRFRFTAVLCAGPENNRWARITLTMPPVQATVSISLECIPTDRPDSLYDQLNHHFETNWILSERGGATFDP